MDHTYYTVTLWSTPVRIEHRFLSLEKALEYLAENVRDYDGGDIWKRDCEEVYNGLVQEEQNG